MTQAPLRIALLFSSFLKNYGGERFARETADQLSEWAEVVVYTMIESREAGPRCAEVVSLDKTWRNHRLKTLGEWASMPRLARQVGNHDAVLAIGFGPALAGALAARRRKIPFIYLCLEPPRFLYDLQDLPSSWFPGRRWLGAILRRLDAWAVKKADRVISISEWTQEQVRSIYGRDSEIVYPGIDVATLDSVDRSEARAALGIPDHQKLYLSLSKLHPRKQIGSLIGIFREMASNDPHARFIIGGDGPDRERLQEALASVDDPRIQMVGYISETDRTLWLRSTDVFLFNARDEPFGIGPLEAKACGAQVLPICPTFPILSVKQSTTRIYELVQATVRQGYKRRKSHD